MRRIVRIPTADHVELEFELAGPVSRFGAFLVDVILSYALIAFLVLATFSAAAAAHTAGVFAWALGASVLLVFAVSAGYFVIWEGWTRGRTPGKRLFGLRVLHDDGIPVGWKGATIRNFVRLVDLLPPPAALVGIASMLASPKGQRLGDMAAGTIVVRESFGDRVETDTSAIWMERVEKGASRQAILLPGGRISISQVALLERFLRRRAYLPKKQRATVAWNIAKPILPLLGEDPSQWEGRYDREDAVEAFLERVLSLAQPDPDEAPFKQGGDLWFSSKKREHWKAFSARVGALLKGGTRSLAELSADQLSNLIADYRRVTADLARARSLGADPLTIDRVNRLLVQGHNVLYGYSNPARATGSLSGWLSLFARTVRRHRGAMLVSALLLFAPSLVSAVAVLRNPKLGYELVPDAFLDFSPASEDNIHSIPSLARPVAASSILTNNLQVSLSAFALGLTAGVGTVLVLVFNGVHLGSVAGWFAFVGHQRAFWGWVMPHGATELLAIVVAGAAGLLLGEAILAPGQLSRRAALKRNALDALILELGCMAMLGVAGAIEGFVSPSPLPYPARIAVLILSLGLWLAYFLLAGRETAAGNEAAGQEGVDSS